MLPVLPFISLVTFLLNFQSYLFLLFWPPFAGDHLPPAIPAITKHHSFSWDAVRVEHPEAWWVWCRSVSASPFLSHSTGSHYTTQKPCVHKVNICMWCTTGTTLPCSLCGEMIKETVWNCFFKLSSSCLYKISGSVRCGTGKSGGNIVYGRENWEKRWRMPKTASAPNLQVTWLFSNHSNQFVEFQVTSVCWNRWACLI